MIKTIASRLRRRIRDVPDGFYDSFEYTRTGRNLTHPVTIGFLVEIVRRLPRVVSVAVDLRFNERRAAAGSSSRTSSASTCGCGPS